MSGIPAPATPPELMVVAAPATPPELTRGCAPFPAAAPATPPELLAMVGQPSSTPPAPATPPLVVMPSTPPSLLAALASGPAFSKACHVATPKRVPGPQPLLTRLPAVAASSVSGAGAEVLDSAVAATLRALHELARVLERRRPPSLRSQHDEDELKDDEDRPVAGGRAFSRPSKSSSSWA